MTDNYSKIEDKTKPSNLEEMGYKLIKHLPYTRFDLYGNGDNHRIVYCSQDKMIVAEYDSSVNNGSIENLAHEYPINLNY